ncbi:MAG: hypothetical protein ACI8S6_000264 [Myxococcota bacterium]|jgi:hypothetical protein
MRATALATIAALTIGCTTVETTFSDSIPAAEVSSMSVDLERGTFSYQGRSASNVLISGRTWGQASAAERAAERQETTDWAIGLTGSELTISGQSDAVLAGVDFDVVGPSWLHADIRVAHGGAIIEAVSGTVFATADTIDAAQLSGSVDLTATSGDLDAELQPRSGEWVRVEANSGDVTLWLPWGGDYDLQVWGDLDHEMIIEDLGFGWSAGAPGYFAAQSGRATTRIDVYATGGAVRIYRTF